MLPCQYNFASNENNDGEDHDIMILARRKSSQQKIPGTIMIQKNYFNGEFKYCSIILCLGIALSLIPTRSPFECRKVIGFHTCYATQLT